MPLALRARDDRAVKNPLNHPQALRAIAVLFLALVLIGVVASLARSLQGVSAAPRHTGTARSLAQR